MMRSVVAVVSVVAVGCADPAPPTPQYLTSTEDNGEYILSAPDYEMRFSPMGVKMPTSLRINQAEEALAPGSCPDESLVGTALYPAAVAAGGVAGTSDLVVEMSGPAVARYRVNYSVPYCGDQALHGSSVFTFFPSGRIVRHDTVSPSTTSLGAVPACGCGSAPGIFFTSFWRFATTSIVNVAGVPNPPDPVAAGCVTGTNYTLAFAWSRPETRARVNAGGVATVVDLAPSATSVPADEQQVTSAIQILGSLGACSDLHQNLIDRALTVDNMTVASDANGIYVDPTPHTKPFDILARESTVPSFAIVFKLPGFSHARVTGGEGNYAIQRYPGAADTYLFWFENGLGMNNRITIEPY